MAVVRAHCGAVSELLLLLLLLPATSQREEILIYLSPLPATAVATPSSKRSAPKSSPPKSLKIDSLPFLRNGSDRIS